MFPELWEGSSEVCGKEDWNSSAFNQTINSNGNDERLVNLRWIAYQIFMPSIIASGVVGNLLNVIVLSRPLLKGVTYVYLSSLTIADFGVMVCAIPGMMRLARETNHSYSSAVFHSYFELPAINTFMASSIFVRVCVTIDRYISVCLPTKFRSIHTYPKARIAIALSYVLGLILSCPLVALNKVCVADSKGKQFAFQENQSVTHSLLWLIYLWFSETVVRFIPSAIFAILNAVIIYKFTNLKKNRRRFREASDKFRQRHSLDSSSTAKMPKTALRNKNFKEEHGLVILLTAIIVLFFVTMTPAAFLSILYSEKLSGDYAFQVFRATANNLEICNFALNFYIYYLCSREFRQACVSLFSRALSKEKDKIQQAEKCVSQGESKEDIQRPELEEFSRNGTTMRPSSANLSEEGL